MGNTTELEREDVKTDEKPEASEEVREDADSARWEGTGTVVLNKGEGRVVDRLLRAKAVASLAAPELTPTLEDLVEIAELIEDEGG